MFKECKAFLFSLTCSVVYFKSSFSLFVCKLDTTGLGKLEVFSVPLVQYNISSYQWRSALKIFTLCEMQYGCCQLSLTWTIQSTSLFRKCCFIFALPCETQLINDCMVAVIPSYIPRRGLCFDPTLLLSAYHFLHTVTGRCNLQFQAWA